MKQTLIQSIARKSTSIVLASALLFGLVIPIGGHVSSLPTVTITSPTNNQNLPAGNVSVAGIATPNTTIEIMQDNYIIGWTVSDGTGNWAVTVNNLQNGINTLTTRAIENGTYGYVGTATGPNAYAYNRLRLSDNVFNPGGGGWPVVTTNYATAPSSNQYNGWIDNNTVYLTDFIDPTVAPFKFDVSVPSNEGNVASYELNPSSRGGTLNSDGSKYYNVNNATGNISVVDVASNTQIGTITISDPQSIVWARDNLLYVSHWLPGSGTEGVSIIDPSTDAVTKTIVYSCPTDNSGGSAFTTVDGQYLYVACALDGLLNKIDLSTEAIVDTIDLSANRNFIGGFYPHQSGKIYVGGIIALGDADSITVLENDTITTEIPLTANTFALAAPSPDGQRFYVSTQGPFDGSVLNIDVVDVMTDSVVQNIDTASVGIPAIFTFDSPNIASASVSISVGEQGQNATTEILADTGQSQIVVGIFAVGMLAAGGIILRKQYS